MTCPRTFLGPLGSHVGTSLYLSPLLQKTSQFLFHCNTFLFHCISYTFIFSPANTPPVIAPGSPSNKSFCLIAYRGPHCDQSPVCAVALLGAGRYIARRYTAIVVPLSHCCVTVEGQEDAL